MGKAGKDRGKGAGRSAPGGTGDAARDKTIRVLEAMNRELLARLRQVELKQADGTEQHEGEAAGQGEADESSRLSSMVRTLRGDIDAAYVLKKALENDLSATQRKLSAEETGRRQFEARAGLLEAKASLADQLREDISFVEEEQNRTFRHLEEVTSELKHIAEERDKLAEAKSVRDARITQLLRQRFELEADVLELKERLQEMVSFFSEKSSDPPGDEPPDGVQEGGPG